MILGGKEYEGSLDWFITQFQKYSLRISKFLLPYVACYARCSVLMGFCEGWETEKMHLMAKMIWTNWRYNLKENAKCNTSHWRNNQPHRYKQACRRCGGYGGSEGEFKPGMLGCLKWQSHLVHHSREFCPWGLRNDPSFGTYTASAGCSGAFGNCRWKMCINRRRKNECSENDQDLSSV